jgi:hypothetical protein
MKRGARFFFLIGITLLIEAALWIGPALVVVGFVVPTPDVTLLFHASVLLLVLSLISALLRRHRSIARIFAYLALLALHAALLQPLVDRPVTLLMALAVTLPWIAFSIWATNVASD